jgi:TPR repeat protein
MAGCFELGVAHEVGIGVEQDRAEAARLYRKACDGDHARSCFNLGLLYFTGDGVRRSQSRAVRFLRKGCKGGEADACDALKTLTGQ